MTASPYASKVRIASLWQRRSAKTGKTYFSGFLGAARLVVLKDERAEVPDGVDGIWNVFVEEKQAQSETSRRHEVLPRRADKPTGEPDFDDEIPFGGRDDET